MSDSQAVAKAVALARCDDALDALRAKSGRWSVWVPGRVELFGKHTDYAGGRSLLCAVERGFVVRAASREDHRIRAIDVRSGETCEASLDSSAPESETGWPRYVATVGRRLGRNFPSATCGVDLAFASDLPIAAGLSSSSALMIAVFVSLAKTNDLRSSEEFRREIFSREELASYLGCIENGEPFRSLEGDGGVGTFGGSQDHTAIMCSSPGRVIQYAFSPVRREAVYRLPASCTLVIGTSGVVAEKTAGARAAYNRAALKVRRLVELWNSITGRRDLTLGDAVRSSETAVEQLRGIADADRAGPFTAVELRHRLDQFVLEAFELIPSAGEALVREDIAAWGELADRSQRAAMEWLGNQVPETVALTRCARACGAIAASSFGAGFGGSVWALVPSDKSVEFAAQWEAAYLREFPRLAGQASFFVSPAGPGAMQW
jgi:galactokinase